MSTSNSNTEDNRKTVYNTKTEYSSLRDNFDVILVAIIVSTE